MITAIESDEVNIDSKLGIKRYFEKEAVLCFTQWRKNAGELKDIDIFCICPTRNGVSQKTLNIFKELNVQYLDFFMLETDEFDCGFWNKPLVGNYFETNYGHGYEVLIHIDLDMYLLEPLDINAYKNNSCLIYDSFQSLKERTFPGQIFAYNTCFIITQSRDQVFTKWYNLLKELPEFNDSYYQQFERLEKRKLEELAFDLLAKEIPIEPIEDLMFGETYTELNLLKISSIKKIRFHHYHVHETYSQYRWLENLKRYNDIKKNI